MVYAAGALLTYLAETQKNALSHINYIKTISYKSHMILDATAQRNLS